MPPYVPMMGHATLMKTQTMTVYVTIMKMNGVEIQVALMVPAAMAPDTTAAAITTAITAAGMNNGHVRHKDYNFLPGIWAGMKNRIRV